LSTVSNKSLFLLCFAGLVILAMASALALWVAPEGLGFDAFATGAPERNRAFVLNITLPRILLAIAVGAGLGLCGAGLQALLSNPLADPYVLGVSGGAAVGAVLVAYASSYLFADFSMAPHAMRITAALIGALLATLFLVRVVAQRGRQDTNRVVLAGIAINILAAAIITVAHALGDPADTKALLLWLMGSLSDLPPGGELSFLALGVVLCGGIVLMRQARALNLLALGSEAAEGAGLSLRKLMWLVLGVTAVIAGLVSALAGMIGFVGLVVPHMVRMILGPDNRKVILGSAFFGATLLLLCDTLSRALVGTIGTELPVGALTALLGAPVLVHLIVRDGGQSGT
jgi:iron complex transport system permease protein